METLSLECLREKTVWNFHLFNDIAIYIKKFSFFLQLPPPKTSLWLFPSQTWHHLRAFSHCKRMFFHCQPQGLFHNTMFLRGSTQLLLNPNSKLPFDPCPKSPFELLWELFFFTTETAGVSLASALSSWYFSRKNKGNIPLEAPLPFTLLNSSFSDTHCSWLFKYSLLLFLPYSWSPSEWGSPRPWLTPGNNCFKTTGSCSFSMLVFIFPPSLHYSSASSRTPHLYSPP